MTNRQACPLLLLLGFATLGAACKKTQPVTELILEIGTNIPVPSEMDGLSLKISTASSGDFFNKTYSLGTGPDQIMLPRRMTLTPSNTGTTVTVKVDGLLANNVIVSRTAITSFLQGESRLLRINLLDECVGTTACPEGQTCLAAHACTDANVDPSTLDVFDPKKPPQPAPLDSDGGAPSDGASDGQSADGVSEDAGDVPPALTDTARDCGADGLVTSDGPEPVDGMAPSDGMVSSDGPEPDVPASKPNGATCTAKAECQSSVCVDGFCCNSDCSGSCMSCKVPGSVGICSLVPLNNSSDGDCPDDGAQTCGRNGKCDGAGGCMLYPSGAECSAETCPAGSARHTRPGLCDGHGVCAAGQVLDCAPYVCNTTTSSCYTSCSAGGPECKPPGQCTNGSCGKKSNGQICTLLSECTSNFCEQGVCCGGPCQGLCMSCAVDGLVGTCSAVKAGKADPQNRCPDRGLASCGTNGLCDGSGACQRYAAGLPCQAGICDPNSATFSSSTCSGSGTCSPSPNTACAPYNCNASGCKKACTVLSDCALGYVCSPSGTCVPPEDCMNGIDDDGNGKVDCADPACVNAGYTCVPQLPSSFAGPGEVYDGPGPSPPCDPLYPTDYPAGAPGQPVYATPQCAMSCGDCKCGDPAAGSCGDPQFWSTTDVGLGCTGGKAGPVRPSQCVDLLAKPTRYFTRAGAAGGGSCTPTGGTPNRQAPIWNTGHLCQTNAKGGLGCDPGYVCWPKPQPPFLPQACIFASGDQSCPSTGYTVKRSYYDSNDYGDTRDCTTSTCICTPHVSCGAQELDLYSKPTCGGIAAPIAVPSPCQTFPAGVASLSFTASTPTVSDCTLTGKATAIGACTPKGNATTACCTP
jgi:hypothetical protein